MQDESSLSKNRPRASQKDITPILKGWDFEAGTINVRKIVGLDGALKLQMRFELGLFQMEMNGRPDGARPNGCESLLDYFEKQLADYQSNPALETPFTLNRDQCELLRQEAGLYYYRYLSLFVLEDFEGVIQDTERNMRVLDICEMYAEDEHDRQVLQQYRPYMVMMNARARSNISFKAKKYADALKAVEAGLTDIRAFFANFGQEHAFGRSHEARVLKRLAKEIRRKLPVDPIERLRRKLARAIKSEEYEEAARLRDKIAGMEQSASAEGAKKLN